MSPFETQSEIPAGETPEPAMPTFEEEYLEPAPQQEQVPAYPQTRESSRMPKAFGNLEDTSALVELGRSRNLEALNGGPPVAEIQDLCHQMVTGNPFPSAHDDEFRAYFGPGYTNTGVKVTI